MPSKARSLHIGVPRPRGAHGEDAVGKSAVADAKVMAEIAKAHGFPNPVLCTTVDETKIRNIAEEISSAAGDLEEGGLFLLTYSGHGFQVAARRPGQFSQSWVLSDGEMFDNEIHLFLYQFNKKGQRVLVISDSCHSGTVIAPPGVLSQFKSTLIDLARDVQRGVRNLFRPQDSRFLSRREVQQLRSANRKAHERSEVLLERAQAANGGLSAHVILLAACKDSQEAFVVDGQGVFTAKLKEELESLAGQAVSYEAFLEGIKKRIPSGSPQVPHFFPMEPLSDPFLAGPPFRI